MELDTLITSGFVAAVVSALMTYRTSERKILIENVTQERTKWREKIRARYVSIHDQYVAQDYAGIRSSAGELRLLLNPVDPEDREIVEEANKLATESASEADLERFAILLSLLLKHDWERAKQEARAPAFRTRCHRMSYQEYLAHLRS